MERGISQTDSDGERSNTLHDYVRRIHSGLNLNGGFVEKEIPNAQAISVYDMLREMNAKHYLARRGLEEMQRTAGLFYGHEEMLQAATNGASPTEGPLYRRFSPGNRELSFGQDYEAAQANQMCGRLDAKIQQLVERHYNLLGRGIPEAADAVEREIVGLCSQDERTFRCTT